MFIGDQSQLQLQMKSSIPYQSQLQLQMYEFYTLSMVFFLFSAVNGG